MSTTTVKVVLLTLGLLAACKKETAAPPAAASEATPAPAPDEKLPARQKAKSCKDYFAEQERRGASVNMPIKTKLGDWGDVPPEVQKVPPGSELCGSMDMMNQAVLLSPLQGKDLEAFYAPLLAKIGCEPLSCKIERNGSEARTNCQCEKDGLLAVVVTDASTEVVYVSVTRIGSGRK